MGVHLPLLIRDRLALTYTHRARTRACVRARTRTRIRARTRADTCARIHTRTHTRTRRVSPVAAKPVPSDLVLSHINPMGVSGRGET